MQIEGGPLGRHEGAQRDPDAGHTCPAAGRPDFGETLNKEDRAGRKHSGIKCLFVDLFVLFCEWPV